MKLVNMHGEKIKDMIKTFGTKYIRLIQSGIIIVEVGSEKFYLGALYALQT